MGMLTVDDALAKILNVVTPGPVGQAPLETARGCVLAEDAISAVDSPPFAKSMMDGYGVRARETPGAPLKVIGELTAGRTSEIAVRPGEALRIMTGAPIPAGIEAVVPVEHAEFNEATNTVTFSPEFDITAGRNIIPQGHSLRVGEAVLRGGTLLRAQELALLAELGRARVPVIRPPRVAVLATGDELVRYDEPLAPGQIRNSNGLMLAAQIEEAGCQAEMLDIARDTPHDLREKIHAGLACDVLCLSGGVSAGQLDLVPAALQEAGVVEVFHKVAIKPGKPIWFGKQAAGPGRSPRYVFGLPGNPVSSMVCFELFVRTALRRLMGSDRPRTKLIEARLSKEFSYRANRTTYFPARLSTQKDTILATPVDWKGSSDLRSTVEANGSIRFDVGDKVYSAGSLVHVLPWGRVGLEP